MSVVPHKMSDGSSVEKEIVAQEKAGLLVAELRLSNSPRDDSQWAIHGNRIDEARLQSELPAPWPQHRIFQRPIAGAPFGKTAKA